MLAVEDGHLADLFRGGLPDEVAQSLFGMVEGMLLFKEVHHEGRGFQAVNSLEVGFLKAGY
jgi:hypothetical protein